MREIKDSDLVGKTIQTIDNSSINVLKLTFTDGSKLELVAYDDLCRSFPEQTTSTPFEDIPGFFVEES
jgi:hypothetical protein